ncbi:PKD domain-containing protein [Methanocaldococcus sp. 28A]
MRINYRLVFILLLLKFLLSSFGDVLWIHPNSMNISNSSGYISVNTTLTFEALASNISIAQAILNDGVVKWDFGDLNETDYGPNKIVTHKYSFPFPYPVAWCGYLNDTGYSKALTYNWLIVGSIYNTTYIFNGSPLNSKTNWNVYYNATNNTVIINYYFPTKINKTFYGLSVDTQEVFVNVSRDEIVPGDSVVFNFSTNEPIIFCVWCFGDGTFSFEKSPTHTYNEPGIYYPRVLLVNEYGKVLVGYLDEGIKVNKPMGGYFEPIRNENYVYNSSGAENVEDIYAMAYKVNDTIYFEPYIFSGTIKYDYGDGTETDYINYITPNNYINTPFNHTYSYPFIYPICWMYYDPYSSSYTAFSATLDYLVIGDVGNTIYEFIPNDTYTSKPKVVYDSTNHTVKFYFYSENINKTVTLKLKQKVHYDVLVYAKEVNGSIQYSFDYPYGKPVFVFWSFGDGTYSLNNSPVHTYPNDGIDYQAHVLIVDENGVVSVGFGPVIKNNKIIATMLYVEPTFIPVNGTVNVTYFDPIVGYSIYTNYPLTLSNYLDLYIENYAYIPLYESLCYHNYIYYWRRFIIGDYWDVTNYNIYPGFVEYITHYWNIDNSTLTIMYKFLKEGIYYIKGYDDAGQFVPRMIKVINNHNPVAILYVYPNPASYNTTVFFNPLNSYDPDAGRTLSDGSGYVISPDEPYARIYGFNLTVYNSSGDVVWNYTSSELTVIYHKFPVGNYTAVLTVWDGWGKTNSTNVTFEVINQPPVANFIYSPEYPKVNETVTFNALPSYDPDGRIVKYVWNFGDGSTLTTNISIVTHTYTKPGIYNVTLTVYDNLNASSSISKNITVYYLKVDFECPNVAKVNTPINFIDKSVSEPVNIVKWLWNFGDGSTSNEQNPTHVYSKEGTYTVTLTVWNQLGISAQKSKIIIIGNTNYPPIAKFNFTVNGLNVTFDASSSYDIDGEIVEYIWDFGDGSSITTTNPITSHKYAKSGIYTVKLTVVDNNGNKGSTVRLVSVSATEKNVPIPISVEILTLITTLLIINYIMRRFT